MDAITHEKIAAYVEKTSREGFDGVLVFKAKTTKLVRYYKTVFGAQNVGSYDPFRLVIWEDAAAEIIKDYQEGETVQ